MSGHVKEIQLPLVTEYDRGWLAGLIDGDGIIGLHISKNGKLRHNKRGFTWKPVIVITNTNSGIIQATCRFFQKKRPPRVINRADGGRRKKIFKLSLTKGETKWVCENLVFHGKDRQRQLLLEAIGLMNKVGGKRPLDHPSELRLVKIYEEMRGLNRRGPLPSSALLVHKESIYQALGLPWQRPEERERS